MTTVVRPDIFHLAVRFACRAQDNLPHFEVDAYRMLGVSRFDDATATVLVWGNVGAEGRLLPVEEVAVKLRSSDAKKLALSFDGSFLILFFNRVVRRLQIITDRTGSLPFYYRYDVTGFRGSSAFKQLFDEQGSGASAGMDRWAVVEFLYFRRLFGTRTYDQDIAYLPYASILSIEFGSSPRLQRYWSIGVEKLSAKTDVLAEQLAGALRASMAMQMSDGARYGLMLSGGLDARALLAAAPSAPVCFTTTPRPNNEFAVAQELAGLKGVRHVYLPRPLQLLNNAVDSSVYLSGGMTVFHEVQFVGYGPQVSPEADTVFLGLALDIMFCGHYLPKSLVKIGDRNTWHFHLHDLPMDIAGVFLDTVSYRLKTSDPLQVLRPELRSEARQRLRASVEAEIAEARDLGLSGYDIWEFMHLHNLSRHYSLLMAQSVRTFAECRIPALTNDLFDLCWAMRAEDKTNWRVYQKAIARLNPAMMKVRNANTNIRADLPLWAQSGIKFARAALGRAGLKVRGSPNWWDRSWPEPRHSIDANPNVQAMARALPASQRLAALDIFDRAALKSVVDEHFARRKDHTVLLNVLITIDRALAPPED